MARLMAPLLSPLLSTERLATELGADDLVVVDGSWRMPGAGDASADYEQRHIPEAVFFPIDEVADQTTTLPHMLPSSEKFAAAVGALGIRNSDRIVVYDDEGLFSAARVWWTFKVMGHDEVFVLDGGLPKWLEERLPTQMGLVRRPEAKYSASPVAALVADHGAVRRALKTPGSIVLDARPGARFAGEADEPRPGLRRGHMPGAQSAPAASLIRPDGRLKSPDELRPLFAAAGVSPKSAVITSCGSGVTAAILSLALETLGHPAHALYDGSWAEWGGETNDPALFPVEGGSCSSGQKD